MTDEPTNKKTNNSMKAASDAARGIGRDTKHDTKHGAASDTERDTKRGTVSDTDRGIERDTKHDPASDTALYRRFLDGDAACCDQLMIRHGDSVTRYLYGYVHDMQEAEDLMIDAFARILVKKPVIGEGAFKAYLYRTARNLALRAHGRLLRMQTFSIEGIEEELPDRTTVESDLGEQEQKRILYECLDRIEPELREALWLVYIENLSYAQAANVMGVKPKRIDRLLARGKQSLRRELEKEGVTNAYDR